MFNHNKPMINLSSSIKKHELKIINKNVPDCNINIVWNLCEIFTTLKEISNHHILNGMGTFKLVLALNRSCSNSTKGNKTSF